MSPKYEYNEISLFAGAAYGDYYDVDKAIKYGIDPNIQNVCGDTPLHIAFNNNQNDIVNLLFINGADINILNKDLEAPFYPYTLPLYCDLNMRYSLERQCIIYIRRNNNLFSKKDIAKLNRNLRKYFFI